MLENSTPEMRAFALDPHTLNFSVSLLGFLAAGLTFSLARSNSGARWAVIHWSAGMLCVGATFLLVFLRSHSPDYLLYVVANALVMAFPLFALLAYSRLFGTRIAVRSIRNLYLVQVIGLLAFQLMDTPRDFAVVALCSILFVELGATGVLIARRRTGTSAAVRWVAASTMLLLSSLFALRVVVTLAGAGSSVGPAAQTSVQIGTLLVTSIALVGSTIAFVLMVHDRQYRETLEGARRDGLTGLYTRRALFEEFADVELRPGTRYALVMVDIDHFKSINDRYGHLGGDTVLAHVGELVRAFMRGSDVAGRYGGEEFCVLLRGCGEAEAGRFAERLVAQAARAPLRMPDGSNAPFTLSAGYASGRIAEEDAPDACALRQVLERADSALYEAKRSGRNRALGAGSDALFTASSVATLSENVMAV